MSEEKTSKITAARRNLLKSMAAGGGAIATGKIVSDKWAEPIVESVMLPAHAQTSIAAGLYAGTFVVKNETASNTLLAEQDQRENGLLDFFVRSSYATPSDSVCVIADNDNSVAVFVNPDTGMVNICVSLDAQSDGPFIIETASTLTSPTTIADVTDILLATGASNPADDQISDSPDQNIPPDYCNLTSMVIDPGNSVTGDLTVYQNTDGATVDCGPVEFTASFTGGSFSCSPGHSYDDDD